MKDRIPPMLPRYLVQGLFFVFILWCGTRFIRWVAFLASGEAPSFDRPVAVDAFLPISGLMNLRHWGQTGDLVPVHPAAALIFLAAILTALLLKRGFCSWACPVFAISEGLWRLGQRLFGRTFAPPFWLDLPLRGLKYLALGFFLFQIFLLMPLPGVRSFLYSSYNKIADVRMLHFFQTPSLVAISVIIALAVLSLFVQMAWCRYLCPYGALLGLFSAFSLSKIRRDESLCVRCGLCSSRCPAWLPVMQKKTIRSPECYACYRCVHNCPKDGAVQMTLAGRFALPSTIFAFVLLSLFIGIDIYGRATGRWHGEVSWSEISLILRKGF